MLLSRPQLLAFVVTLGLPGLAFAAEPTPNECIATHERALSDRRDGALLKAREGFAACGVASCPDMIRTACERLVREVNDVVPSLVVSVVDDAGADVTDVSITVDGDTLAPEQWGRAIDYDPGPHHVVVASPSGDALVERDVVVREGQKARAIQLIVPSALAATTSAALSPPLATWVLGGVALAGLTGFAIAGSLGLIQESKLDDCAPGCTPADDQVMRDRYLAADISLVIGIAGAVAGGVVWVVDAAGGEPSTEEPTVAWGLGLGSMELRARF